MRIEKYQKRSGRYLNSLAIALFFCAQYLSTILTQFTGGQGYFAAVMIGIFMVAVIGFVISPNVCVKPEFLGTLCLIISYYLLTITLKPSRSTLSTIDFLCMCIFPMLCGGMIRADYKLLLKIAMLMLCLSIPIFDRLFTKANTSLSYDAITMGTSYNIIPPILAGIAHFIYFRGEATKFERFLYVVSAVYLIAFISMAYRGPTLALLISVFILIILRSKHKMQKKQRMIISATMIAIVLLFFNYRTILEWLSQLLESRGVSIAFIQKTVYLATEKDIANGRISIYIAALHGFIESPLYGHGMGTFQYYTGYVFPHNFILQLLFDGGLILTIPVIVFVFKGLMRAMKFSRYQDPVRFVFVIAIAGVSLTRVMVSAEMWRVILLWLMVGMVTNDIKPVSYVEERFLSK